MAKHQQTVYVSGALCGFSEVALPGMDHADYPWDTVPKVVSKIFKSQLWHDQRQRQYRLAREFVDAGVAMIHIDDLAIGMKKFTIGQGRTIVPTQEYLDRLTAVRMQFDVMGAETLLLCRCDTDHAEFITSVVDERDHEYVQGATKEVEPLQKCLQAAQIEGKDLKVARDEWKAKAGIKTFDEAVEAVATEEEYAERALKTRAYPGQVILRRKKSVPLIRQSCRNRSSRPCPIVAISQPRPSNRKCFSTGSYRDQPWVNIC